MILALFYFELLYAIAIRNDRISHSFYLIVLFSLAYGLFSFLPGVISKKQKVNHIIKSVILFILPFPYLIEYFVLKKFQVMYDVRTIIYGSGGAVGGFSSDIMQLIFSVGGMFYMVMFFLPFILSLFLQRKIDKLMPMKWLQKGILIGVAIISYVIASLCVHFIPDAGRIYNKEYNFEIAVREYGLATAMRLDVKYILFPPESEFNFEEEPVNEDDSVEFEFASSSSADKEKESTEQTSSDSSEAEESTGEEISIDEEASKEEILPEEPIEYGKNVMEIDFESVMKTGTSAQQKLDEYVKTLEPTSKNKYTGIFKDKNLIFITAEAFSDAFIDPDLTPTLYRMIHKGIYFTDFYQPANAGTTGGEFSNLMGSLATFGGSSMSKVSSQNNQFTLGVQLSKQGYYGRAYHNNDYTFYKRDVTHTRLGYSDGYVGYGNGIEKYVSNVWPESDREMIQGSMADYINEEHFNIYYMTVSGHSNYEYKLNAMTRKHWDQVKDLEYSEKVKCYIAGQLEVEEALTYLLEELEKAGHGKDTVICLSPDHFPYGLDDDSASSLKNVEELYGRTITNNLDRDRNGLIIWCGSLEDEEPIVVNTPTFSPDILPTLSNLFGLEYDSRLLVGRDALSDSPALVYNLGYDWKTEYGMYISSEKKFVSYVSEEDLPENYINNIKNIVRNKISYSKSIWQENYYEHVLGNK